MAKLMISIRDENFRLLSLEAKYRGITIQELLRAVIVPDWIRTSGVLGDERRTIQLKPPATGRMENEIQAILGGQWSQKRAD
jgi:hypothetical protein